MAGKTHLIIESFNLMGYDAMGIGDDDLTLGKEFLLEISRKANFPFVCSNLLDEASGKNLFQTFLIKEINGLRVGLFSLLLPDFFTSPSDPRKKGLNFRSPLETAQAMVRELKPKTDLIILLSHLGYAKDIELAQRVQRDPCHLGWPYRDQSHLFSSHQKHHYKDCRQKLRSGIRKRLFLLSLPDLILRRNLFQPSPYSAWVV